MENHWTWWHTTQLNKTQIFGILILVLVITWPEERIYLLNLMRKFRERYHSMISPMSFMFLVWRPIFWVLDNLWRKATGLALETSRYWSQMLGEANLWVSMKMNRMLSFFIHHETPKCLNALNNNKDQLWYLRYGHLSFESLKELGRKKMVYDLPYI